MSSQKEQWSSNFGFLMATIASAVGLGSIWKFPYLVGSNGGSAFIIIYTILIILIGILGLSVENSVGRFGGTNVVDSYAKIHPKAKWLGTIALLGAFLVFLIYSVLGGWVLHYLFKLGTFQLQNVATSTYFSSFMQSDEALIWQILFTLATMWIVGQGVAKGIEKYSTVMNILLFALIILVAIRGLSLPNAKAGIDFLLKPDPSAFSNPKIWLTATGQALFSLSLGMGIMVTYGSYVPKQSKILKSSLIVSFSTLIMAILMGFAIFPALFAMGFSPEGGAGLLFIVLPEVFAKMSGGTIFAVAFFVATFFAAITSAVSIIEPIVSYLMHKFNLSRKKATISLTLITLVLNTPIALAHGRFSGWTINGKNLFNTLDFLTDSILLPLNTLIVVILAGWFWKKRGFLTELSNQHSLKLPYPTVLLWIVRILIPLTILIIVGVTFYPIIVSAK
ncbi:sodium-dependent transporter [Entomospira culicis]|uniref:Sodium-dependent transporter n=1 Tax=Entomospira culicis TaxID=2719989 RepID=A0A968GIF3_9SPIO|nr:sodium-dependent transporter [Entomospira culicis]NIZ19541.1 sodium-dependent transporter [Entomospira culicis]NIZ69554.1 sodium-dependent transporter [Entomospira culicis]WDI36665.1 sodium-dependent transporter [Entomospira culicis]WDI38294.1 sodium-dependent transporter [Entomospira culicis]